MIVHEQIDADEHVRRWWLALLGTGIVLEMLPPRRILPSIEKNAPYPSKCGDVVTLTCW